MKSIIKKGFLGIFLILFLLFSFLFVGSVRPAETITWGANFSQKHTDGLQIDWQETYLALLDDLGVREFKIAAHWDLIQPGEEEFFFGDIDWMIERAEERDARVLLVMGMKTPRWPECHLPGWARELPKEEQQAAILRMLEETVTRYKDSPAVWGWQVENEPFFGFGDCPWTDGRFFAEEVALVRSLDPSRPIVVSDSGEMSFWFRPASLGDIVGTTMYRKVWFDELERYITYPIPPVFYQRKANIIEWFFGKEVMVLELQAEPWGPGRLIYDTSLEDQDLTMNAERFRDTMEYARNTGLDTFYLWGAEWWYWMKEDVGDDSIWEEARKLFDESI